MYMKGSQKVPGILDTEGRVHHEFVSPRQCYVLQRLRDSAQWKRRNKWQRLWFLHHDNVQTHTSLVVQQFQAEKNILVINKPLFSPDLAQSESE
jgi:hypothetical protein